jgi:hypothetical protein
MKFPLAYEATTTRADFLRILPLATGEAELREIDGRLCGRGWAIRLTPIAPLEIGWSGSSAIASKSSSTA